MTVGGAQILKQSMVSVQVVHCASTQEGAVTQALPTLFVLAVPEHGHPLREEILSSLSGRSADVDKQ